MTGMDDHGGPAMTPRDDFTATVDAAAAFEWRHSEPDYDDRPTLAECERDEAYLKAGRE